jgi:uncharacterized membrane-anchored protein
MPRLAAVFWAAFLLAGPVGAQISAPTHPQQCEVNYE